MYLFGQIFPSLMLPFAFFTPSHGFLESLFGLPGNNAIYLPIESGPDEKASNKDENPIVILSFSVLNN
jgi:hypothetical protein